MYTWRRYAHPRELHIHIAIRYHHSEPGEREISLTYVCNPHGGVGTSICKSAWKFSNEAHHANNCLELCVALGHLKALNDDRVG